MGKNEVLQEQIPDYSERKRRIEAEPLPENVGVLLDEAANEGGDEIVLNCFEAGETLTYTQLRAQVNKLANGMRAAGIHKGTHVGVMMPNIAAFPVTWLALARLGAVMVPINIAYKGRELEYVVETADVTWLFIDESCLAVLDEAPGRPAALQPDRVVVVGKASASYRCWSSLMEGQPETAPEAAAVGHDDLLNIQFTSGTTGFPKGAMLTQGYWLVSGKQNAFRDGRTYKRILASTPFFYMDPQWQFLMTMFHRGTLFLARRQSASRYMDWVRTYRIQFGLLPDVVFKQPPSPLDAVNEVIRVNIYGLSKNLHAKLEERFNLVAREVFGMTEIGSGLFVPIEATDMIGSGSCGIPVPFRDARIVDENGEPVAAGEVGELQIRGRSILKGYYKNPEATAAAFQGDWFRTGDLFRQDERGNFTIVGRLKDMIRRAGENISAREVEAVIMAMPEIAQVAAVPVKDDMRGEEVKIYVVLQNAFSADDQRIENIIDYCMSNLAPFKVPRYYEIRNAMPITASGKIAKTLLTAEKPDLRTGSYDRVNRVWL